ncbi:MAG: M56 family metallopeptidase [Eubacteriales bacterium]
MVYRLWSHFFTCLCSVVLFRLLCPFSLESALSLLPKEEKPITTNSFITEKIEIQGEIPTNVQGVSPDLSENLPTVHSAEVENNHNYTYVAQLLWIFGIIVMLLVTSVSLLRLKKKLRLSKEVDKGVFFADDIRSPFVFGVISPKIHLPSTINEEEIPLILAHERLHLKRFDHVTRLLSFVALTLHWFNPLAWISYYLSEKDMETSCDEGVLREKSLGERGDYATALLKFTGRRTRLTPLAFSENDTKGRVKNIIQMKKTKLWVSGLTGILMAVLIVGFATNKATLKYDTAFASFTVDSFLKYVFLDEISEELIKAQEEMLLPHYAIWGESCSVFMTYELLPDSEKTEYSMDNFIALQVSDEVNSLSRELFSLYYPEIRYTMGESVMGETEGYSSNEGDRTGWEEEKGFQKSTVTYGTVSLEISPIDIMGDLTREDLGLIWAELREIHSNKVILTNAYLEQILSTLIDNFTEVHYKSPVELTVNMGLYNLGYHAKYVMLDTVEGDDSFTELLYTLCDFHDKY